MDYLGFLSPSHLNLAPVRLKPDMCGVDCSSLEQSQSNTAAESEAPKFRGAPRALPSNGTSQAEAYRLNLTSLSGCCTVLAHFSLPPSQWKRRSRVYWWERGTDKCKHTVALLLCRIRDRNPGDVPQDRLMPDILWLWGVCNTHICLQITMAKHVISSDRTTCLHRTSHWLGQCSSALQLWERFNTSLLVKGRGQLVIYIWQHTLLFRQAQYSLFTCCFYNINTFPCKTKTRKQLSVLNSSIPK